MHRVHVPNATGETVELTREQAHHLTRVLRLAAGAALVVFDGRGREWEARVLSDDRTRAVVALVTERTPLVEPLVAVRLAIGVLTGDQMTDVIRDATALGAASIAPFLSAHTAVSLRRDWTAVQERWERVAVAAAMQAGRAIVPAIAPVAALADVRSAGVGTDIVCVEPARKVRLGGAFDKRPATATLFVGPEGGWSEAEVAAFEESGAFFLSLGPRTLRAELAPTVALSTLWAKWNGVGEAGTS